MDRRWLVFILLSFAVIQLFTLMMSREQQKRRTTMKPAGQTTATLHAAAATTGSAQLADATATASETADAANARPAAAEETSRTYAAHPGEITTLTTERYAIGVDRIGAVINSWRVTDIGTKSFRTENPAGVEMVCRIPSGDPARPAPQTWPLEISFREDNARGYEELNTIEWNEASAPGAGESGRVRTTYESPVLQGGIRVTKAFDFAKDRFFSTFKVTLHNETTSPIRLYDETNRGLVVRWGPGLLERNWHEKSSDYAYDRSCYRMNGKVYAAAPGPDKPPVEAEGPITWAGVESKFFSALLVPYQPDDAARLQTYYFRSLVPTAHNVKAEGFHPPLTVELATGRLDLAAGASQTFEYGIYVGPKRYGNLKDSKHDLQTLMFFDAYGFMRPIYLFLTDLLNWIFRFVGNYGIAIIILTIMVRLAAFPLTQHSIKIQAKTMAEQSKVKPYIDAINEKYKDDPQEKNRQVWKVYQEHGISPFGALRGCVPMLLQMPVFIGLYRVCSDTIDLQGASFLWMKDLSVADHLFPLGVALPIVGSYFNLLPILMGVTQMIATKVSMARIKTMDATQKQMMYMMPVMMAVMLYTMPSGLMIYWNASNVWQIFQTFLTNRQLAREEAKHAAQGGAVVVQPAVAPKAPPKKAKKR